MSIEYKDRHLIEGMPFDKYIDLRAASFSGIRYGRFTGEQTEKMKMGTMVDAILTEKPDSIDMFAPNYPIAKAIAASIREVIPVDSMMSQVVGTANACLQCEDGVFSMPVKGRLDFLIPGRAVIDLKVSHERDIDRAINYFRYPDQLWHYAKLVKVDKAYLVVYKVRDKQVIVRSMDVSEDSEFWKEAIVSQGEYSMTVS